MKKWLALGSFLFALLCPQVWANTYPNNYAVARTASFNPSVGTAGTITLSFQFSGSLNPQNYNDAQMCSSPAKHYPVALAKLWKNGALMSTSNPSGGQVGPCTNMVQTLLTSFDLAGSGCSLDLILSTTCTITEQSEIWCTGLGAPIVLFQLNALDWENAIVYTREAVGTGGPPYAETEDCTPASTPADWHGPYYAPDTQHYRDVALIYRTYPYGGSPKGQPWNPVPVYDHGAEVTTISPGVCTVKDKGIPGV